MTGPEHYSYAEGQDISHAELTIGALHEPLFECGRGLAAVQGRSCHAVRETLAC